MSIRNLVLTHQQAEYIEQLVTSGRYPDATGVLREGLRLIERQESRDNARLKALQAAVRLGDEDIAAGRFSSFDSPDDLGQHLAQLAAEELGVE